MLNLFLSDKKTNTRMLPFNNMNKIMSFYGDNNEKGHLYRQCSVKEGGIKFKILRLRLES